MRSIVRTPGLPTALLIAAFSCSIQACLQAVGEDASAIAEPVAELKFAPAALGGGTRHTLIDGITSAENQLFTSTGRLLVSGDEGIYEIVHTASGSYESRALHTGESCFFGGLAEQAGVIYANCYDFTDSLLFAARLAEQPEFRVIYRLPGTALANGLTSDGVGSLFIASTFDGRIIRLLVAASDPLSIQSETSFDGQSGPFTNGLKFFEQKLYWTALTTLNAATVTAQGTSGPKRSLASALTFFDDLSVDSSGILVADGLNGLVVEADLNGEFLSATPSATFDGPSSVEPANGRLGLSNAALIVTERSGNRVSVFEP